MRLENCHLQFDPPLRDGETEGDRLAELQRKMRSGQTGGWRDISEAPKDGTYILVWSPTMEDVYRASWVDWNGGMWHPDYAECPVFDEPGDVTHFMFLPEPPDIEG